VTDAFLCVDAFLGVDVGGTKIAGAVIAGDLTAVYETAETPRSTAGADPEARATRGMIKRLLKRVEAETMAARGVCVGVPEYVTTDGEITSHLVLADSYELPKRYGLPGNVCDGTCEVTSGAEDSGQGSGVAVDSDVRCAAFGELLWGAGRGLPSFCYVTIGTGISHTMVIAGSLWPGQRGEAIALGELPVDGSDIIRSNAPATLEQQASGLAIERALTTQMSPLEAHSIAGGAVAKALATLAGLLDPAAVIIGGGLGLSTGAFSEALHRRYGALVSARPDPPPLVRAELGKKAGAIGAALLARETFGTPTPRDPSKSAT